MNQSKRRSTIGDNPLDALIPAPAPARIDPQPAPRHRAELSGPSRVDKERLTIHVPVELLDRLRNAVYWTPGLTLAGLAEDALGRAVAKLEKERGEPFPHRRQELKGGRPLK